MTQWLNLASHSLKGSSGNKQCSVFLWAFKSSGRTWTMKRLLSPGRLPFTHALCGPRPTFLKGQHALAPSHYPLCFHTINAELSRRTMLKTERLSWNRVFGDVTNDHVCCTKSKTEGEKYASIGIDWIFEKRVFNTRMEPDLNATMPNNGKKKLFGCWYVWLYAICIIKSNHF